MFAIVARSPSYLGVAGDLIGAAVPELDRSLRAAGPGVTLDLAELRRVDAAGAASLCRWRDAGLVLTGVSPRVSLLLESPVPSPDPDSRS